MTQSELDSYRRQGFNRVPLIAESFSDLETPLSLYLKLADAPNTFLLESVVGGERFGRYSFIGLLARTRLATHIRGGRGETIVTHAGKEVERHEGDPLDFIQAYLRRFRVAVRPGLPRFCGGLAGYFGYDTARAIEPKLAGTTKPGGIDVPDILLLLTEELAVVDNLTGKLYFIVYIDPGAPQAYQRGLERLRALRAQLREPIPVAETRPSGRTEAIREFAKADYLAAVAKAKEYVLAGDMMQVQIGQRIRLPFRDSPLLLYRALRSINPSPYMYFYNFGDFHVVGASPEILVRQETRETNGAKREIVTVRPIAGTKPRGATPQQDEALAQALLADPKERAEHVMLIDLARNDIGRIADIGSVKVTDQMVIEKYSHVQHIVSNVEGVLKPDMTNLDVLRATFPAGTLTGAPKVRAMEIIDELEPVKRGIYGGACGYLSFSGAMDLAIAIRTGIVKDNMLYVQAAAGIVADSDPESEWRETEAKARAVLRAAELVQDGLDQEV
ncbi:MAG: anthranilate synthase component I [Sulfurifustaceae bacterium]